MLAALFFLAALPAALEQYAGVWTLIDGESDAIGPVTDQTVSRMNFFIRGIAATRLRRTQIAFPTIQISAGREFQIRHEGGTAVVHRATDTTVRGTAPDGSRIGVRLSEGPPLAESYESPQGKRENTYILSADRAKLTVNVRVTSPRLPAPVVYKLTYRRTK